MGTSSKDIELIIKSTDQSSKPVGAIAEAVDKLVKSVGELVPASEKGEAGLNELKSVASGLKSALEGLKNNSALIETFQLLSTSLAEQNERLQTFRERLDAAKLALDQAGQPTKKLRDELKAAQTAFTDQERSITKTSAALEKQREKAVGLGIDLNNLAGVQSRIGATVATAAPAYEKVNGLLNTFAENQRRVAAETAAAAAAEAQAAKQAEALANQAQQQARIETAAQNARTAAQADYLVMLDRAYASQKKKAEADAQAVAAFKAEVIAAEEARSKITAKVVADNEAAAAAERLAKAEQLQAAAEERVAGIAARAAAVEQRRAEQQSRLAAEFTAYTGTQARSIEGLATAQGKAAQGFKLFNDGGRESLSLVQRIRGEVLSLTAAYVGIFGAINAVSGILDTVKKRNTVENVFEAAFGKENVGAEMEYVRQQADRLGFQFLDLAEQYGKFAVASKSAGQSVHETRVIFESFSEVSRVLHLSQDQTNLVFTALTQIASKGKFAMQELRQQLGNDLPGAFGTLADSLHLSTKELEGLLGGNGVSAKLLTNFAQTYREKFAGALSGSLDTVIANQQRFATSLDDLKLTIADGGFLDAFNNALKELTKTFKSSDGKDFAQTLAKVFTEAANGAIFLAKHLGEIVDLLTLIIEVKALQVGIGLVDSLGKAAVKAIEFSRGLEAGAAAARTLGTYISGLGSVLTVALVSFDIGTFLYNQFPSVQRFSQNVIGSALLAIDRIKLYWLQHAPRMFGGGGTPDEIKNIQDSIRDAVITLNDISNEGKTPAGGPTVPAPPTAPTPTTPTPEELEANLREIAAAQTKAFSDAAKGAENRLAELRAGLLKKEASTFGEFKAALQKQYEGLFKEIAELAEKFPALGAAKAKRLTAELNDIINQTAKNSKNLFDENKAKSDLQAINGLLRERNDLVAGEKQLVAAHAESPESARTKIAAINAEFNAEIADKIANLQTFLDKLPPNVQQKLQKVVQDLKIVQAQLIEKPATDPVADIEKQFAAVNDQLRIRDALIEAQKSKQAAGTQTQQTTLDNIKQITEDYSTQLDVLKLINDQIEQGVGLTAEQKAQLIELQAHIQIVLAKQKQIPESLYTAKQAATDLAAGGVSVADSFAKVVGEGGSLSDAFHAAGASFVTFAADFLLKIGEMILQAQLLKLIMGDSAGGSGSIAGLVSGLVGAGVSHTGSLAGSPPTTRSVSASIFAGAQRYHGGGLPGLSAGEVPIIAKKREEVLSENDPRNVLNGGTQSRQPVQVAIHNQLDTDSIAQAVLSHPSATKAILNIVRANRTSLKQALA
jgi:tape measure domain-containing protein